MPKAQALVIPAIVVGIALLVVAVIYWVDTASALPSFFPGHQAGASTHHVKHGIAALVVAVGAFIFAWFQSAPKASGRQRPA
jgi:amino acid permease